MYLNFRKVKNQKNGEIKKRRILKGDLVFFGGIYF